MSVTPLNLDTGVTATLSTTAVVPVLTGAVTGTGGANAGQTALSDLATFFAANAGPVVTTSVTFSTKVSSATALATPSALAATAAQFFASTVSGATLMGYGTTGDVTLKNRAGTDVIVVTSNTTGVTMAGALAITGALSGVTTLAIAGAITGATTITGSSTLTLNATTTSAISIGSVSSGQINIGRGSLTGPVFGKTLTALGTVQNSTPTIAQLLGGVVTQTSVTGAGTVTLPNGTTIAAGITGVAVGDTFETVFTNLGGGFALTITGATGSTVIGTAAIPSAKSGRLTFINTGTNTWDVYCNVSA